MWQLVAGRTLTLARLEAAVVAHRAEELKNKDGHSHNGQAHDEHHHPHGWTVGFCTVKEKNKINKHKQESVKLLQRRVKMVIISTNRWSEFT